LRTGPPWRDLPGDYGDWKNTHRRFCRWRDRGVWEALLEHLVAAPDFEWLMIDASHIKVHPHAAEAAKSRKQWRSLKQLHENLLELVFKGSYDRVAAFARQWREAQTEWALQQLIEVAVPACRWQELGRRSQGLR
jgi:hypothetical protein